MRPASLLVLALLPGCSFALTQGPPDHHRRGDPVVCDTHRWPIVADLGLSAFGLLFGIAYLDDADGDPGGTSELTTGEVAAGVAIGLAAAAPFVVSAMVGRGRVTRCQQAQQAHAALVR